MEFLTTRSAVEQCFLFVLCNVIGVGVDFDSVPLIDSWQQYAYTVR